MIGMFTMLKLCMSKDISPVKLYVTVNVIRRGNQNKAGAPCFSTGMMSKLADIIYLFIFVIIIVILLGLLAKNHC